MMIPMISPHPYAITLEQAKQISDNLKRHYDVQGRLSTMDTQACETPMSDHIFRFWQHLETEHVRILLDLRRDTGSVVYWDSSSFPDAVAKALVVDYRKLEAEHELMRKTLETIAGGSADQLQATQARGALANIGPSDQ